MFSGVRRLLRFCALIAALVVLTNMGGGATGVAHLDCADDGAACACTCHDDVAVHTTASLFFSNGAAETITGEPHFHASLIPADIFRPPIA
jgi:hypothetical protein